MGVVATLAFILMPARAFAVQVKFNVPCKDVAHILIPGCDHGDVEEGADAEMPLWLAQQAQSRGDVSVM
jgi:hypothetical protein